VQRALSGPLTLRFLSYRDYSPLPHAQVDDAPFGGGAGMLSSSLSILFEFRSCTVTENRYAMV